MLAGLTNRSWLALRQLYNAGAHGLFDVVALHPYTRRAEDVLKLVRFARRVMAKHGDGALPIWITELSWPAAEGRKRAGRGIGIEVSAREQAALLAQALRLLARARKHERIERVLWYTWLSSGKGPSPFDWSGLRLRAQGRRRVDPGAAGVPRSPRAGSRAAARRPATRAAAPSRPRARPRRRRAPSRPS